ncbi:MAG: DUF362 domain-containing protein [Pseudomonadota bacterium]
MESKVILTRNPNILTPGGRVNKQVTVQAIHKGLIVLTGKNSASLAWRSLFSPNDVVGIKVNGLSGQMMSTHPDLVNAIVEGLRLADVPDEKIIIWDRTSSDLTRAGFIINVRGSGVKCFGTEVVGYDEEPEIQESIGSCFSRILSTHCTALINVPVLKDHDLAGVTLSLKNFYGAIHNPNKYHDNNCDPYIADLNTHPFIKDKLRLVVCDGIEAQYNGGPSYKPRWRWNFSGLIMSFDPVAADSVGANIIETKRKENGLPSLEEAKRPPKHIATAAKKGLGMDDLTKIKVLEL